MTNLTRSPVFSAEDARLEIPKVVSVEAFLRKAGVQHVSAEAVALHASSIWCDRPPGSPDIVVSAANEFNVRYHIEMGYPPIQVYATTGKNWQATLLRHVPGDESCSMCMFPPDPTSRPMECATDSAIVADGSEQVDAALPFLSFAAGLMTAAEILKLGTKDYVVPKDKVSLNMRSETTLVKSPQRHRKGCACEIQKQSGTSPDASRQPL